MPVSEALKEERASSGGDVILNTLTFTHSTWPGPLYMVRDYQDFPAQLESGGEAVVFKAFSFSISGPDKSDTGTQSLKISVDTVNQEIINLLELAVVDVNNVPIEVTYRVYLASDPTAPQIDPPLKLWLKKVKVNNSSMTGQAELVSLINRKFPSVVYGPVFKSLLTI
jgi:hypothetical protein